MKKIVIIALLFACIQNTYAQSGGTKPATKQPPIVFKNMNDSASYALGRTLALGLSAQGYDLTKINRTLLNTAMNDVMNSKPPLLETDLCSNILSVYITKLRDEAAKRKMMEGQEYLAKNKLRPGVITTASGLQYEVIRMGNGEKMTLADTFVCHYRGTLINGEEFDASYNRNQPLTMSVGAVIKGWTEGLLLMPQGSKFRFFIPSNLGYGERPAGRIPANSVLLFDVELLDIKRKQ